MRFVYGPLAHGGRYDRQMRQLLQALQRLRRARCQRSATGHDHRLACLCKEFCCRGDGCIAGTRSVDWPEAEHRLPRMRRWRRDLPQQIRWQQQHRGARPAASRRCKSGINIILHPVSSHDAPDPFGTGLKQGNVIELLKGVAVQVGALHLLDERHDRHACLQRFGKWRDQQRRGWAILGCNQGNATGSPRISIGHGPAHILLAIGNLANASRLSRQDDRRGKALRENELNAMALQCLGHTHGDRFRMGRGHHDISSRRAEFSARKASRLPAIASISASPMGVERQAAAPLGRRTP